jgi:D-hydroxyproline dehydrogenase subunit alpha
VVGAGPAGIAAACAAADCGRRTAVIDDNPAAGGQIWRGNGPSRKNGGAGRWLERLRTSGAVIYNGTRVIDQSAPHTVLVESDLGAFELRYEKLILATGARELFLPFPGWTLPHVTGAGGLQALVKSGMPVHGKTVVVAGSGPLLLAVAAYLRKQGARIARIAEQTSASQLARFAMSLSPAKWLEAAKLIWNLAGVPYTPGCWPVSTKPGSVILRREDRTWGESCDFLACGFGLVPNLELPCLLGCEILDGFVKVDEWQQTSVSGAYCAGEPTGIGGFDLALIEGAIAGKVAAGRTNEARKLFGAREKWRRFQRALKSAFTLRPELKEMAKPPVILCRCEDVPVGRAGAHHSWRSAKLQTRCGMGPCQGRICGPAAEFLFGWTLESVRPPLFPARLEDFVGPGGWR